MKIFGQKQASLLVSAFLLCGSASHASTAAGEYAMPRPEMGMDLGNVDLSLILPLLEGLQETFQSKLQAMALLTLEQSNKREIMLGNLAIQKASKKAVRSYAGMLVKHHKIANDKLKEAAELELLPIHDAMIVQPTLAMDGMEALLSKLAMMSDMNFNMAYLNTMIALHMKNIAQLNGYRSLMTDGTAKQLLDEVLPQLVEHLIAAQNLKEKLSYLD